MKIYVGVRIPRPTGVSMRDGYKKTEIGVIPLDWDFKEVKNIAKIKTGKKDTQDKVKNGKYPFFVRSQTIERINSYSFDGEAVLTAGDGVGVGKIYHYLNEKFEYHQRVYNIHDFSDEVDGKYFFEYFKANFYSRVSRMSAKNSVDSVRLNMISKMKIPLPPLTQQKKIAKILSTTDNKIEAITKQIEKAEMVKKGLMQRLLSKGIGHIKFKESELGMIPLEWEVTTIGKSSKNFDGKRIPLKSEDRQKIKGNYPYYGAQGIIDYINNYIFYGKYLLVAEDGENVKEQKYDIAFVVEGKFWVNNHAHILQENKNMDLYFISSILNHMNIIKYVTGTGQPKLNKAQLNLIKIPFPPLKEQKKIATILTKADQKIEILKAKKEQYQILKTGLMQKLLTGEIGVGCVS